MAEIWLSFRRLAGLLGDCPGDGAWSSLAFSRLGTEDPGALSDLGTLLTYFPALCLQSPRADDDELTCQMCPPAETALPPPRHLKSFTQSTSRMSGHTQEERYLLIFAV